MKYVHIDFIGKYGLHYFTEYRYDTPDDIAEFFHECAVKGWKIENVKTVGDYGC